jgi:hypothetical protein
MPEPGEPLSAGTRYETSKFEPALSFRIVDEGWQVVGAEIPDIFDIVRQEPLSVIAFNNPRTVYDPKSPVEQISMPEPEAWVAWFQNHPYLNTGKPTSVDVGGVSGVRFDWEASSVPDNYPERCGDPCIPLWPLSDGGHYDAFLGDQYQFTIVKVGGETVLIDVFIDAENVDAANREVQEVLDTVEWKSGS